MEYYPFASYSSNSIGSQQKISQKLFPVDGVYAPDDPISSQDNENSNRGGLVFIFVVLIALFGMVVCMHRKGVFRDCAKQKPQQHNDED